MSKQRDLRNNTTFWNQKAFLSLKVCIHKPPPIHSQQNMKLKPMITYLHFIVWIHFLLIPYTLVSKVKAAYIYLYNFILFAWDTVIYKEKNNNQHINNTKKNTLNCLKCNASVEVHNLIMKFDPIRKITTNCVA